jgi:ATP-dependent Clp protease ATP-binding subunit ClpB
LDRPASGKTELTLECSRYLFGEGAIHRFDMSEFQHLDSVKLFLGDETGMSGRLGKVLESHTRGILLFDEVEKAHRLIWDLFLQMLDAARITLADHSTYDLSGFYVVCTSNIGSQPADETHSVTLCDTGAGCACGATPALQARIDREVR